MNPETIDLLREAIERDDCPEDLRGAFADLLMTGTISPSHFGLRIPYDISIGVCGPTCTCVRGNSPIRMIDSAPTCTGLQSFRATTRMFLLRISEPP